MITFFQVCFLANIIFLYILKPPYTTVHVALFLLTAAVLTDAAVWT